MNVRFFLAMIFLPLFAEVLSYKVLVVHPMHTPSHLLAIRQLTKELLGNGHQVHNKMITSYCIMCVIIAMCYISMDLSQRALLTNGKLFFSNFEINKNNFKRIARREY